MTSRNKAALELLQASFLIGLLGNLLLRATPWGLNAFLFVALFVLGLLMLWRRHRPDLLGKTNIALAAAMVFFASMFLIRDAEELLVFDTLAIIAIMGVLILANFDIKAHIGGAVHYIAGLIGAGIASVFGGFLLLGVDIEWKSMPGDRITRHVFAVLRGLAIALPLVLVFGALFMAADAVFEGWVNRAINFDLDLVISHVMITSALAWLTAGYFRGAIIKGVAGAAADPANDVADAGSSESFVAKVAAEQGEQGAGLPNNATVVEHINTPDEPAADPSPSIGAGPATRSWQDIDNSKLPSVFTFGTVETVIILGLVNALFLGFVVSQVPYLFGGMDLVQNTPDFKLAEYARRGFGELVVVAALVLPMLLVSQWLVRKDGSRAEGIFKVLAGIQIVLLFVIMASAMQRLLLLTGSLGYGLTTVRFYPMMVMVWLSVVFIWFAATVLRGARNYFAWGALWSAIFVLAATNLVDPHDLIARTNISLMKQGREFDVHYNTSQLSQDAVAALIESFGSMSLENRCWIRNELKRRKEAEPPTDLRNFNFSRSRAEKLLESVSSEIETSECRGKPWLQ
jgi:hypothetical protein